MAKSSNANVGQTRRGAAKGERRGGRQRGTPNKVTRSVTEAIQNAFNTLGGDAYLVRVGREDHGTFCRLLSKLLPRDVSIEVPVADAEVDTLEIARRIAYVLFQADPSVKG